MVHFHSWVSDTEPRVWVGGVSLVNEVTSRNMDLLVLVRVVEVVMPRFKDNTLRLLHHGLEGICCCHGVQLPACATSDGTEMRQAQVNIAVEAVPYPSHGWSRPTRSTRKQRRSG